MTQCNDVTGTGQRVEVDDYILSAAETMNALALMVFISHRFKKIKVLLQVML